MPIVLLLEMTGDGISGVWLIYIRVLKVRSPFSKEIHRIMIRYLSFKIALHNRHNNFYA